MSTLECPICSTSGPNFGFKKDRYSLYECSNCDTQFIWPLPEDQELAKFYQNLAYHSGERYDTEAESAGQDDLWRRRFDLMQTWLSPKGALLDIGCATGKFLKEAKLRGWEIQGIEKSSPAARQANRYLEGEYVEVVDPLEFDTPQKFTVVTFWALIEHLRDPKNYLLKVRDTLVTQGMIAFSTPNTGSLSRWLNASRWRYYIPPEHLFYFNRKSIGYLLESCGFEILKYQTQVNFVALLPHNSSLTRLYLRNRFFRIFLKSLASPLILLNGILHLGETMEVYARKRE